MKANVKLYSLLRLAYPDYKSEGITTTVHEETMIKNLITNLGFDMDDIHMVVINGKITGNMDERIKDKDLIQLFPQLPGGG